MRSSVSVTPLVVITFMLLGGACESESEVLSTKGLCHAEGCQADVSADPLTQAPGHNGLSALLWVASSSSGLEPS